MHLFEVGHKIRHKTVTIYVRKLFTVCNSRSISSHKWEAAFRLSRITELPFLENFNIASAFPKITPALFCKAASNTLYKWWFMSIKWMKIYSLWYNSIYLCICPRVLHDIYTFEKECLPFMHFTACFLYRPQN